MSGHSKWNNIKRKKEKTDGARAKVFTKIGREISVAVRDGGPNPASNSKLADLIAKAKRMSVPNDNIQRIIKKAEGGDKTEYDVIRKAEDGTLEVQYGTGDAYKTLFEMAVASANFETYQKMRGLNTDGTRNPAYPIYLDVDNFIDYMLVNQYGGNGDWDHHNWVAVRRQGPLSKGFRWVPWDSELVLQGLNDNVLDKNNKDCPSALFYTLMTQSNHFRQTYNDRLHLRCGEPFGALSPDSAYAVWKRLDNSIDQAMYCESARWGDYRRDVHPYTSAGQLYTKEGHYDKQKKQMVEQYFPQRSEVLIQQVAETGWYSTVTAPPMARAIARKIRDRISRIVFFSMAFSFAFCRFPATLL